jgi:hypothetical protein
MRTISEVINEGNSINKQQIEIHTTKELKQNPE